MALIGDQRPRLEHIPTYHSLAAGEDAVEYSRQHGLYLDDWQQYVLKHSLSMDENNLWSAFEVLLIVSRQNGKGSIYEARELFGLFCVKSDRLLIHTAHEHKTASEHFLRIWTLVENNDDLMKQVGRHSSAYGREFIETKPKPTIILGAGSNLIRRNDRKRLIFIARSSGSGRGFTGDFIAYDEDMILEASKVEASLPSLSARPNPQVFYAGSAGLKNSTQLAKVRRRGVAGTSKRLLFFEWSANICDEYCEPSCTEHDDPEDERTVAKTNPAYGIRITSRFIDSERDAFEGNPVGWYRERLGVGEYPAPEDGWFCVSKKWFEATIDKRPEPERVVNPIFSIDISPDRSAAAISVAGLRQSDDRVGIQVIEHLNGTGWVVKRAIKINEKWKPACWVIDKRAAAGSIIAELEKAGLKVEVLQAADVAHASGLLFDAFRDDTLRHYGQASFKTALAGADWRKLSESRAFDRVNSAVDIAPLMSSAFAHWGYLKFGVEQNYDARDSVYFSIPRIIQLYRAGKYGLDDIQRLYDRGIIGTDELKELSNAGISI